MARLPNHHRKDGAERNKSMESSLTSREKKVCCHIELLKPFNTEYLTVYRKKKITLGQFIVTPILLFGYSMA
jgi:hypothetical protein